jgi:hypothetical protein
MNHLVLNRFLALFLLLVGAHNLLAQDTIKVDLYKTTDDYIKRKVTDTSVSLIVKEIGENHIQLKKFVDAKTGKNLSNKNASWALVYKGSTYLNLGYTNDLNNWKVFLKLNLEGNNFCASFIDETTPNIVKNSGNYYGGGLTGVLIKESNKWGKNWFKKDGSKAKILFMNLHKQNQPSSNRHKSTIGYFITKKELADKLQLNIKDQEIEKMSFENAVSEIKRKNNP